MQLDVSGTIDQLRSTYFQLAGDKLLASEKQVTVHNYDLVKEKADDMFVLFYAFYKDDAYTRRLKIPTYLELYKKLSGIRSSTYLLFAYEDIFPVAAVWVTVSGDTLTILYSGSIKRGYELHADHLLVWEAVKLAKTLDRARLQFDPDKLFHGMMSL
jgi:hypothetical protein